MATANHNEDQLLSNNDITTLSTEVLHQLGRGVFIVTSSAVVLFANTIAQRLLGNGLRLSQHQLTLRDHIQTKALHDFIRAAATDKTRGSIAISRAAASPLLIMVIPFRADNWLARERQPAALVFTKEIASVGFHPLDAFSTHYSLTPAETRVAKQLLVGDGIAGVARRLNISDATARTHRIRIFQKTNVRRQAELVRVVMEWTEEAVIGA